MTDFEALIYYRLYAKLITVVENVVGPANHAKLCGPLHDKFFDELALHIIDDLLDPNNPNSFML
jgi:hypothetical protein